MFLFLASSVFAFFLLFNVFKLYCDKRRLAKCTATIPGPKSYFLLSNMDVLRQSGKCCLPFHKRLLAEYGGICKLWVNTSMLVLINDPDLVRDCLMSTNYLEKPFFYKFFRTPFGLLNSDYHYWRENRKLMNPTFNNKILSSFMPIFIAKSEQMIGKLAKRAEGGDEFNIFPFISNCTLKTVFATSFGIDDTNGTEEEEQEVIDSINGIYAMVAKRMTRIYLYPEVFYKLTAFYREESKWFDVFYTFVRRVLKEKFAEFDSNANNNTHEADDRVKLKPQIFIDQLVSISRTSHHLSSQEIEDQCTSIIFAGNETTALSTSYIVQMLAMHPDVQQRLFEEVAEVWPIGGVQPLDEEVLKRLTYMDLVIKETMRLFPVGALLGRVPMAEGKLGPYTVCPGTIIGIDVFSMHRRKDIWGEDADQFRPDRFTLDNSEHRHPFCYIPFSGGPRNCIGYRYAVLALKTMLVHLVRSYEFTSRLRYDEMKVRFSITLKNELGYHIKARCRRTSSSLWSDRIV